MMRRIPGYVSILAAVLVLAATQGCKKNEPLPPTTPPPTESQVPAQSAPTLASTGQTSTASSEIATSNIATSGTEANPALNAATTPTPPLEATIPSTNEAAANAAPDVASGAVDGAKIYQVYCQACHGEAGNGDGPAATSLNPKPANFATRAFRLDTNGDGDRGELEDIVAVIRDGAAKYGGSPMMAPWPTLTKQQQDAVAKHVKTLGGAKS